MAAVIAGLAVALTGHHSTGHHSTGHHGPAASTPILSILAFAVSVISLLATGWIGYLQYRAQSRLTAVEQARRADEISSRDKELLRAQSAAITAQWQATPPALIVSNDGQAPATGVTVMVSSAMPGRPPPAPQSGDDPQSGGWLTLEQLGPGEPYAIPMTTPYGMASAITADLRWDDEAGSHTRTVPLSAT